MSEIPRSRLEIDLKVYTQEALLKSAYRFTARCFVEIREIRSDLAEVILIPKSIDHSSSLAGDFLNDLLDQRLRSIIAHETAHIRDRIMAHALSQTNFLRPDLETGDYRQDPLCIAKSVNPRAAS